MPKCDDENFFLRWSRRKRDAGRGMGGAGPDREAGPGGDRPDPGTERPVDAVEDRADTGAAAAETVPDDLVGVEVAALDYDADFTRFMQEDVPEALRKRALRQLWRSDPILANVDGLNDYDDDFTDAALAVKVLETAHKIGRGYLDDDDADRDEDVGPGGDDMAESAEVRAEDEDAAVEPRADEGEAVSKVETLDRGDEILARIDGADPSVEGEGEVTRTS